MTPMLLGGIVLLLLLAVVAGLWVGLLGHRKAGRDGPWWTMFAALILITLGVLVPALSGWLIVEVMSNSPTVGSSSAISGPMFKVLSVISYTFLPLGLVLFSIGFALNGLRAGRIFARMKELEQISDAMGDEISRLNSRPSDS